MVKSSSSNVTDSPLAMASPFSLGIENTVLQQLETAKYCRFHLNMGMKKNVKQVYVINTEMLP